VLPALPESVEEIPLLATDNDELNSKSFSEPLTSWQRLAPFHPAEIAVDQQARPGVADFIQVFEGANRHGAGILASGDADCNRAPCKDGPSRKLGACDPRIIPDVRSAVNPGTLFRFEHGELKRFPTQGSAVREWKIAPHTTSRFFQCPLSC
jgi:hypothetical protein